jgi:hypothetical protein
MVIMDVSKYMFKLILILYAAVFSIMPLHSVHIEGRQNGYTYICDNVHYNGDLRILLHEVLYSHFENKSEHLKYTASVHPLKDKAGDQKGDFKSIAVDTSVSSIGIADEYLIACDSKKISDDYFCFSASGISPPAV